MSTISMNKKKVGNASITPSVTAEQHKVLFGSAITKVEKDPFDEFHGQIMDEGGEFSDDSSDDDGFEDWSWNEKKKGALQSSILAIVGLGAPCLILIIGGALAVYGHRRHGWFSGNTKNSITIKQLDATEGKTIVIIPEDNLTKTQIKFGEHIQSGTFGSVSKAILGAGEGKRLPGEEVALKKMNVLIRENDDITQKINSQLEVEYNTEDNVKLTHNFRTCNVDKLDYSDAVYLEDNRLQGDIRKLYKKSNWRSEYKIIRDINQEVGDEEKEYFLKPVGCWEYTARVIGNHGQDNAILDLPINVMIATSLHTPDTSELLFRKSLTLDIQMLSNWVLDAITSVEILHRLNYVHRDIKPENFVVRDRTLKNTNNLTMIDFGMAQKCARADNVCSIEADGQGTREYVVPKYRGMKMMYSAKAADWWALALTCLDWTEQLVRGRMNRAEPYNMKGFVDGLRLERKSESSVNEQPAIITILNQLESILVKLLTKSNNFKSNPITVEDIQDLKSLIRPATKVY